MELNISWLATLAVLVAGVVIGAVTAAALPSGPLRTLWAALVSLVFIAAGVAAVLFDHSWMFTNAQRVIAEGLALGAAVTGIIYAIRAPN